MYTTYNSTVYADIDHDKVDSQSQIIPFKSTRSPTVTPGRPHLHQCRHNELQLRLVVGNAEVIVQLIFLEGSDTL